MENLCVSLGMMIIFIICTFVMLYAYVDTRKHLRQLNQYNSDFVSEEIDRMEKGIDNYKHTNDVKIQSMMMELEDLRIKVKEKNT